MFVRVEPTMRTWLLTWDLLLLEEISTSPPP
jgi:hypothetical protein